MANICSFSMKVKGKKEDIEKFCSALEQKNGIYMGRGATINSKTVFDDFAIINGDTKWSIWASLIHDAQHMKEHPDHWAWLNDKPTEIFSIEEATKLYNVSAEVYSEECGNQFQEHYIFKDGETILKEVVDFIEIYPEDYETKEEAEENYNVSISDEDWEYGECIQYGGFENWEFNI